MPQERLSVRKITEILRLKYACHLSHRAIARSCQISHSTVGECLRRAQAAHLSWPLPEELTEEALELSLYPEELALPRGPQKPLPDWKKVNEELKKRHVTMALLWDEYRKESLEGYGYSQFCELYHRWKEKLDPPMRQKHLAGDKLYVDYAGDTVPIVDPETGEVRQVQIFVAVLGASNYTYAEAQEDQTLPNWIGGHVRSFVFLGGLPQILVPDNLTQGVKKANRYEPDLNPTYFEMAEYYGLAVIPARARRPRDKSKVEVGVQVVERWILARLRNRTFFSLGELNRFIQSLLGELNNRKMEHLEKTRRELFDEVDRPALRPLPERPYEFATFKTCRVNIDYHVEFEKHFYSVPYTLIHEEVRIRATEHLLEIFHKRQVDPVALHPRSSRPGMYTTQSAHMPPKHQSTAEWSGERLLEWAGKIGPQTSQLVQAIIASKRCEEQAFRSCLGILRLSKGVSSSQMESACQAAIKAHLLNYTGFKTLLEHLPEDSQEALPAPMPIHENIRGQSYYQ
jgi:transposase